jgi:Bacteriocin-protection, YdeI or OmpD-Associated/Domain of unknown function (DUF1905)
MVIEFSSVLKQAEGMTATGIPVPDDVVARLGSTRNPPVTVRVRKVGSADWYTYRMSIATRGGYILSFSSAHRAASGLAAGDPLEVTVELDTEPRILELPEDLTSALTTAGLLDKFLALSNSKQRAFVDPIEATKAAETRQRRVEKTVSDLGG